MAGFAAVEEHPHAAAVLGPALAPGGSPSHAYLFHGPAGAGKRAAARAVAAALLAEGAGDPEAVAARVQRGSHPDLTWVRPSGARELLVGDVDEAVVAAAARTPFEARRRVFVIERADTMVEAAANRMLKTLEEPPAYAHLILLTDRPDEVMETVASRCQSVRFDAPPPDAVAARLEAAGAEPAAAAACARLGLGNAERAAALALGDGPALRAAAEAFAAAPLAGEAVARRAWEPLLAAARAAAAAAVDARRAEQEADLELLPRRERRKRETEHTAERRRLERRTRTATLDLGLQVAGQWHRDLACLAWGAEELVHATDRLGALRAAAPDAPDAARLRAAVELVEETRQRFAFNVDEDLACEALACRLEEALGTAA